MSLYDPVADVATPWSGGTGSPHYAQIDDAVRSPTDPGTSDYIRYDFMDGSPANEEITFINSSPAEITEIRLVMNISNDGPGPYVNAGLKIGGSYTADQTISGTSRSWVTKTFNASSDPTLFPIAPGTKINARFKGYGAGPGTSNSIYAAYLDTDESAGGSGPVNTRRARII